jgi:hypothetical protein
MFWVDAGVIVAALAVILFTGRHASASHGSVSEQWMRENRREK